MMIESSSYNGMAMATLVVDIQVIKNSCFVKMTTLGNILVNKNNILTKNEFLMACISATNVAMPIPSQDDDSIIIRYIS